MRAILVSLIFLVTACNAAKPSTSDPAETEHQAKTIQLTIQSGTKVHKFDVEVARTPEEQAKGLMFRKELPAKGGMLFPFDPPQVASFWMKNTVIPLRSEEHTSELQSLMRISYAVFCLKKKN